MILEELAIVNLTGSNCTVQGLNWGSGQQSRLMVVVPGVTQNFNWQMPDYAAANGFWACAPGVPAAGVTSVQTMPGYVAAVGTNGSPYSSCVDGAVLRIELAASGSGFVPTTSYVVRTSSPDYLGYWTQGFCEGLVIAGLVAVLWVVRRGLRLVPGGDA